MEPDRKEIIRRGIARIEVRKEPALPNERLDNPPTISKALKLI
jgi:hypothetical protein